MCKFFSVVSDGAGNVKYFDNSIRKEILARNCKDKKGDPITETDSHSSILAYFGIDGAEQDLYNKYEYNPLIKEFTIDAMNNKDDSELVKEFCKSLDYKTIVPELQIHDIINPRDIQHSDTVNDSEIALLMMWASVWDSVRASVRASVWASVRASVWASVCDSVWAYISSFFSIANYKYIDHETGANPFQPCIDLWNLGLVPSFDGKTWRLHKMCDKAKIIYRARA